MAGNGYEAYFVRDGDIYHADLRDADPKIMPKSSTILNGTVHDLSDLPAKATIQIETADGHIITTGTTNKLSGEFSVSIPETNQPFKIRIQSGDNVKYYDLVISEDQREINLAYTIEKQAPEHIILFDFDSHYITQDQKVKLDKFIARIKLHPETKIHMAGHTCSDGSHEYNIELSENRAKRIYNHLAKMGIPKSQIEVAFHGAKQPSQSNGYASGRTANRRVEILVK